VAYCPTKSYFVTLFEDITERKKAESALGASEIKFRTVANFTYDWEYWIGPDGAVLFMSPSCERFTGFTSDEFTRNPKLLKQIVHPEDRTLFDSHFELVSSDKGHEIDFRIISQNGIIHWVSHVCQPVFDEEGKRIGRRVSNREITKRKKAEEALSDSEERYRHLVKYAPTGIYEIDFTYPRFDSVNDSMCEMSGYTREELLAKNPFDLLTPESQIRFKQRIGKAIAGEKIPENVEYKVITKGGKELWATLNMKLISRNGRFCGAQVVAHDTTERKEAEEAIKDSEAKFSVAFNASGVAAIVSRWSDGRYIDVNETFLKVFGYKREEVIDQTSPGLNMYAFPEQRTEFLKLIDKDLVKDLETVFRTKTGQFIQAIVSTKKVQIRGDEYIITTMVDITKRKKAELELKRRTEELENTQRKLEENAIQLEEYSSQMEELAQQRANQLKDSERLAAIGATAGMVGHDIRNPLQAIIGDLYLAKTELASTPKSEEKNNIQESLTEIEKNIDYINKIVQDLQDYARPLNPNPEGADLKLIIDKLLSKNSLPKNVKVTVKVEPDARRIVADSDYLTRILYNLVTNAVQAMPKGGKLTIQVCKTANDVILAVKDTGVGIPETVRSKLFTPMFTTKSKGQGFGLPAVKRMTESLGGTVSFESQEGKGTTFTVRLPHSQKS
jgi:PAS domain S-box-containing protein